MALAPWLPPLAAVLLMQVVAAFQSQSIWVLAPILTGVAGVAPERVGELAGLVSLGSAWFFLGGTPLLQRLGSLRALQLGAVVASASLLVFLAPWWPAMMAAALLIGIGYGPTTPAGSDVLARYTPVWHKAAMFSIKQAGAPLGGAVAGLSLPALAALVGWQAALVATATLGLGAILIVQRLRHELDADRDASVVVSFRMMVSPANLARPVRALALSPRLPLLTAASFCFAAIQGNLFSFAVTYLTDEVGLTLVAAGAASSAMLLAGVVGRVAMGWLADRTGSALAVLKVLAVTATAATLAISTIGRATPYPAILAVFAVTGIAATTWNGVFLAEVARIAPKGMVGVATAGSAFVTFLAYTFGPIVFARAVSATGAYGPVFAGIAGLGLAAGLALVLAGRRPDGAGS
jgi:MFS family permease